MGTIERIFIAPQAGAPMISLDDVEALADCGLRGDRYAEAGARRGAAEQVTLIEVESIEAFVRATGRPLAPHAPRRNLVTRGVRLNALCGQRFLAGEAELEGLELCEPCASFARNTYPEVVRFFVHRGGLRARIVRGGVIRTGEPLREHRSPAPPPLA